MGRAGSPIKPQICGLSIAEGKRGGVWEEFGRTGRDLGGMGQARWPQEDGEKVQTV